MEKEFQGIRPNPAKECRIPYHAPCPLNWETLSTSSVTNGSGFISETLYSFFDLTVPPSSPPMFLEAPTMCEAPG